MHIYCVSDSGDILVSVTGSVGEGLHMTPDERKVAMEAWVKYGKGK